MKISEQWLREWVDPEIDTSTLVEQLTMAGLEVDSVNPVVEKFTNVVIGEVVAVQKHPDADRLRVCSVNVAKDELLQIVCGAKNVRETLKVAVALEGAKLPNGLKIRKAKLRGVPSCGMICSVSELGLEKTSDGIMELSSAAPVGEEFFDYYRLADNLIELELTPNRGDCLSIVGVAREVAALNRCDVKPLNIPDIRSRINDVVEVDLEADQECPHYICRIIRGVNPNATTPLWLKERLRRSGINCISPIVDVTNYVMFELGQPLHAFDLHKVDSKIHVRAAKEGETLTLLDGQDVVLKPGTLLIADEKRPLALAGIMGGVESSVTENTEDILLESAFFNPEKLAGRARSYGLHTDSSHRFERGVDPQLQKTAIERATTLVLEIVGGEIGPINETVSQANLPSEKTIYLRRDRIPFILGVDVHDNEVLDILQRLGMEVDAVSDGWHVKPPSYRFDLQLEVDLVEELARIYGYNNIPEENPKVFLAVAGRTNKSFQKEKIISCLVDKGYHEIITYSFVDPNLQRLLDPNSQQLAITNPISKDLSVMRTNMWSGLLKTLLYNQRRQQERFRLFEIGLCFSKELAELRQNLHLGGVIAGDLYPEQWAVNKREVDFFDIKGDLESLLELSTNTLNVSFRSEAHPALHPGRCAKIYQNKNALGFVGLLHPRIKQELNIKKDVYLFDLNLTFIYNREPSVYEEISRFPHTRRDLAVLVDSNISARRLKDEIHLVGSKMLREVEVFDVYQGDGVVKGKKSVALRLLFQNKERTLLDEEVDKIVEKVVAMLKQKLNAVLRG